MQLPRSTTCGERVHSRYGIGVLWHSEDGQEIGKLFQNRFIQHAAATHQPVYLAPQ